MTQAVILAGGKGTRLAARLNGKPKPLVILDGIPLLERQLNVLRSSGIDDVLLLVNHRAEAIVEFLHARDNLGMRLSFVDDGEPRGTAGAVLSALPHLADTVDTLLILYGDTLLNIDFERFLAFHAACDADATLFLHPNDHPQDSDLVEIDAVNRIRCIHPYPHTPGAEYPNLVNAALYAIKRKAFDPWLHLAQEPPCIIDFAKNLFPWMLESGQKLSGYVSPEYIKDVGTPDRLDRAEAAIRSGRFAQGSLKTPKAAFFLDRDGVINKDVGHLARKDQFELLPGVAEAIQQINHSGMLSVVVTNQPVIARGDCTEEDLAAIHARMDTFLGQHGAYVDKVYHCPHHPDKGFPGECAALKIRCACRKPATGMLEQAARDLNITFSQSWLVGDRTGDILAAKRAGIRSILVRTGAAGFDDTYPVLPDYTAEDLLEACTFVLQKHAVGLSCLRPFAKKIVPGEVILVGGLARSGKSTVASLLRELLARRSVAAHILPLDSFLRSIDARGEGVLQRYDMQAIEAFAAKLHKRPLAYSLPLYKALTRITVPDAISGMAKSEDVLIVEGVLALSSSALREQSVSRLYVSCSETIRKERFKASYEARGEGTNWEELYVQRLADENPVVEKSRCFATARVKTDQFDLSFIV